MSERIKREIRKGLSKGERKAKQLFNAKKGYRVRYNPLIRKWFVESAMIIKDKRKAKKIAKKESLF